MMMVIPTRAQQPSWSAQQETGRIDGKPPTTACTLPGKNDSGVVVVRIQRQTDISGRTVR